MNTEKMELAQTVNELFAAKKFSQIRALLSEEEPADLALLLEEVPREHLSLIFRILPKELAAEIFVEMDTDLQELLLKGFSDAEMEGMLKELYLDDTVDIIEEMPANVVKRILLNSEPSMRKTINEVLNYPADSVGSIMTIEYVHLKKDMTVRDAFRHIRETGVDKETIYTCYVTDLNRKLLGLVTAQTLMLSDPDAVIADIMDENVISVTTLDNREEAAKLFDKYNFLALPVVDREGRLVGIVTVDDAIDVITEETEEDFAKMAAITPTERPYLKTGVLHIWLSRTPWLLLLMISATFTGMIINQYENALAAQVALTAFIPMLMGSGGNSGSQASVTVIRGLSMGEVEFKDIFRIIWKEARVAVLCGLTLAAVNFVKIMLFDIMLLKNEAITLPVAGVVCISLALTVLVAKMAGGALPLLAKKMGFDPVVMASPFISTITDAVTLIIYFNVAGALL